MPDSALESTATLPPWARAISLTMNRPRPTLRTPLELALGLRCFNQRANSSACSVAGIGGPSLWTSMARGWHRSSSRCAPDDRASHSRSHSIPGCRSPARCRSASTKQAPSPIPSTSRVSLRVGRSQVIGSMLDQPRQIDRSRGRTGTRPQPGEGEIEQVEDQRVGTVGASAERGRGRAVNRSVTAALEQRAPIWMTAAGCAGRGSRCRPSARRTARGPSAVRLLQRGLRLFSSAAPRLFASAPRRAADRTSSRS